MLESMLSADTVVLGVDEHTAVVFDLDADMATVVGRAALTLRRQGVSTVFASGTTIEIEALRTIATGGGPTRAPARVPSTTETTCPTPSLRAEAERLEHVFDNGLTTRDVNAAVTAVLELEQAIVDWSADTEEMDSAEGPRGHPRVGWSHDWPNSLWLECGIPRRPSHPLLTPSWSYGNRHANNGPGHSATSCATG
jgi:hypothetical protein